MSVTPVGRHSSGPATWPGTTPFTGQVVGGPTAARSALADSERLASWPSTAGFTPGSARFSARTARADLWSRTHCRSTPGGSIPESGGGEPLVPWGLGEPGLLSSSDTQRAPKAGFRGPRHKHRPTCCGSRALRKEELRSNLPVLCFGDKMGTRPHIHRVESSSLSDIRNSKLSPDRGVWGRPLGWKFSGLKVAGGHWEPVLSS